jgi:calcineurin-like phosphoesterase family protein
MTIWFTSDEHYGHRKICQFARRPFSSVDEMKEEFIKRHNERVKTSDTTYHLGDFSFRPTNETNEILRRLNGTKHLILGNHDKGIERTTGFASIKHYDKIYIGKTCIILMHYGMRVWEKAHHGALHLFGHSHGKLLGSSQALDVGVDCWDYYPVDLDQIVRRMKTLPEYTGYQTPTGKGCHDRREEM